MPTETTPRGPGRPPGSGRMHDYDNIYNFIVAYKCSHDGNSPSIREIADACDIPSTSHILHILLALQFEGKIKTPLSRRARNIEVVGGQWIPPSD